MNIVTLLLIAISLSVDAFCVSLSYGLLYINNKKIVICSAVVGMFHFIMPLLGYFGSLPFLNILQINSKYIISSIFMLIIFEIIKSFKESKKELKLNYLNIILLAFLVSIDSFTVGIGLSFITNNVIIACVIFSIVSASFTFTGMKLGKILNNKFGSISKILGITLLFLLTLSFLFK